ncbi:MAG: bifunctional phosphoglucose/phosphomannose isomerase [Candidatus Omnitrophica bacterium]|nr:bifunctional phosphoglucose/phosphomannose isomerase [Candidatus Omnitrophota bacterium]
MKDFSAESIRSIDKSKMLDLILDFPRQIRDAKIIGDKCESSLKKGFNKIVFTGLGGSAIGADLIRAYLHDECKIPIMVNRDYTLPAYVDKETLLIVSSYSGNTEETLSAHKEGVKKGADVIAITTDGKLKKRAERDGFPCILIPKGLPPRCALGYSSIPIITLLSKSGLIGNKDKEIEEASMLMEKLRDEVLSPKVEEDKNIGKRIARSIQNKYVIIYAANKHFDVVLTRWRGQLAENAKTISSTHVFPEMNHNEIMGWRHPANLMKDLAVIMIRDSGDHPRVKKRMDISRSIIQKEGVDVVEVSCEGGGLLSRIFLLIYIGDFVSLYLALLNNIDPTPVDSVTYLKKELAKA